MAMQPELPDDPLEGLQVDDVGRRFDALESIGVDERTERQPRQLLDPAQLDRAVHVVGVVEDRPREDTDLEGMLGRVVQDVVLDARPARLVADARAG